ncbi:two-component system, chemotaxis family [Terrimicrobium sacchariphilum]|uniref:histidine kinase n=1 Tax=Terrimicrobium sacchariphilum TaxID=690879 RepID=A0A146GCF3_TERSA|nr:response regulator [Terrimicrobium sacchariphilum]GAT35051.1 two-component system, chemotaxis family [Terrimicrobium sacchariphilum]
MKGDDLSGYSMDELFRAEAEQQCAILSDTLLRLEKASDVAPLLEILMRAAHSLKGAARIVGNDGAVRVAHAMEDLFVKAQKENVAPVAQTVDVLLSGVDLLRDLSITPDHAESASRIERFLAECSDLRPAPIPVMPAPVPAAVMEPVPAPEPEHGKKDVRLDAERLDNLLALAGQAVVSAAETGAGVTAVRAALRSLQTVLSELRNSDLTPRQRQLLRQAGALTSSCQSLAAEESERRDLHDRRLLQLCGRIYRETLSCRMRPFGDVAGALRRLVRDLARDLGKEVDLVIQGEDTEVDRDMIDRFEGALSHLIRNALDHGLETPAERLAAGKPPCGRLEITAHHHAGWLSVSVADDGRGMNVETIRQTVIRRGFSAEEHARQMSDQELSEFLLLPGFSLSERVTEISGRGVGLDAVRSMAYEVGGSIRLGQSAMGGFLCEIILPVALSLLRAVVVEVSGERYAFPLARIERIVEVTRADVHLIGGIQHAFLEGEKVEIFSAAQVLEVGEGDVSNDGINLVIIPSGQGRIGLAVDRLLGMKELSLQRLDGRLGRTQDVSSAALLEDGEVVIVLDINDLSVTAANFSAASQHRAIFPEDKTGPGYRILVADDSLTVRELERKLLVSQGYEVDTAVDGADAWNALRSGKYDLLVTDIDMPRLDGIELVKLVRNNAQLRDLPVIVMSYKERDEDRARGLEAGADYYLTKSSYQDESILGAVRELLGQPSVA